MKQVLFNIQRTFNLTEHELEALNNAMEIVTLDKNEAFLKEDEICNRVALIEKGCMRLFYGPSEKEKCNDFFFENSVVVSLASFLTGLPSAVAITAVETTQLLTFNRNIVFDLIKIYPNVRRFAELIVQEQLIRTENREASLLKDSPVERFKNLLEEHPKIFKRVPLHYVASYLNISPETLSRYRTNFLV